MRNIGYGCSSSITEANNAFHEGFGMRFLHPFGTRTDLVTVPCAMLLML